ncbi:hypothetical protein WN944_021990 [Citrus x changshan-huyou]|uniref:Uncharacterized protein n=1 Tax=Citrus x changshan-huyou TaxID=2935761 RepID=A0AAP0R0X0_9ROSI
METDPWVSCKLNSEKLSALLIACYHGHLEIVKVLLNQPWLLESEEENVDQSSLDVAVSKGQLPLAMQFDNFVYSPLHLAAMKGDIAILQDFGGFSPSIVSEVFGNNHLLHESNRNGDTILHVAISKGHCQKHESNGQTKPLGDALNNSTTQNLPTTNAQTTRREADEKHQSRKHRRELIDMYKFRHNKQYDAHREALQNARNTITLLAILIGTEIIDEAADGCSQSYVGGCSIHGNGNGNGLCCWDKGVLSIRHWLMKLKWKRDRQCKAKEEENRKRKWKRWNKMRKIMNIRSPSTLM